MMQPIAPSPGRDAWATRAYVVGEILISLIALSGGLLLVFYSTDEGAKLAGSGLFSAVTVFWFQRRASEQSNTQLALLADGKITQLLQNQDNLQRRVNDQVALLARISNPPSEGAPPKSTVVS